MLGSLQSHWKPRRQRQTEAVCSRKSWQVDLEVGAKIEAVIVEKGPDRPSLVILSHACEAREP